MAKKPQQAKRTKPAYQRIKENILKNIHSGKWQAGEAIPTEMALAERFSVSRMTVNRALKELSEDRVLERRQGSGTYVAQQQYNHTVVEVRNIAADIKAAGKAYEAQVIYQKRLKISEVSTHVLSMFNTPMIDKKGGNSMWIKTEIATSSTLNKWLESDEDEDIDSVEIVHIADGKPVQFEERWVDASLVPNFIDQDFTVVNTSEYLIEQAPLQGGSYTIRAVAAPKKVANALQIKAGEPALLLSRQTYSAGRVVTFVNMWHAGNGYQFSGIL
ncbi:UTRA domain-containing protein [Psychrobacter sp. FDAARGOS_221]|uniref:UTRA domain-containing protein n=1 Tax=Psychrobacter sp. FDAARGOS_221 TaxID=1975705 RepID=UPI000C9F67F9|nr:UTRA domain-containing protein [Psychrobacter sp. FDAARGOS_221]PNK61617.1 GntR family transcriptional regulator [Psychrobacter sp. FDAARGOS_221]